MRFAGGAYLVVLAPLGRNDQRLGRVLGVQQRNLVVGGDRRLSACGDLVGEGRDEGVVRRAAVLAEEVGQDDLGQGAGQRGQDLARPTLAPTVGVVAVDLHRACVDHVHRAVTQRGDEPLGKVDVALLDLVVGLGAVDAGDVDDDVNLAQCLSEPGCIGVVLTPQTDRLESAGGEQPAGQVPAQEPVRPGDGDLHRRFSTTPTDSRTAAMTRSTSASVMAL